MVDKDPNEGATHMSKLSKEDAQEKKDLLDDADRLEAEGDNRGAENLRLIADEIRPTTQPQRR